MAFSREEIEAFIAELQQDPQLRDRVRNTILADDFLALPGIVARLGERVDDLGLQIAGLASQVAQLTLALNQLTGKVTNIEGQLYEFQFERKIGPWIGPRFRRARVLSLYDIEEFDEALRTGALTTEEADDANDLDLIVQVEDRGGAGPEAVLAFEVSVTVDASDVVRASRRAEILRRCGINALPAVAGDQLTREAAESLSERGVLPFVRKKTPAA